MADRHNRDIDRPRAPLPEALPVPTVDAHAHMEIVTDAAFVENDWAMRKDIVASAVEMLETAGFKNVSPYDRPTHMGLGIHDMGTARMGHDPKTSVLNAFNQVHDCKNVFVTDGAAMASSSCVNPSITYMALTARAVDYAVKALKKKEL